MGILYIVATPIGNREDITLRALRKLKEVNYIVCEDTRRTGLLLKYYREKSIGCHNDNKPILISFYDEVEEQKVPEIIRLLHEGKDVALVSNAGTPLISDPGFKLVRECYNQGIAVSPIPGPSSVIASVSASGMPTDKFLFIGYLPKKKGKRKKVLSEIAKLRNYKIVNTVILFETPHRIEKILEEIKNELGDIKISICSELTKVHERIIHGKITELLQSDFSKKGEFVILL